MLSVDGLEKRFGEVVALDGMSFRVDDGHLVGFIGPNGAGKTTTMRAILGLLRTDAGQIRWNGEQLNASARTRFGYMPEERGMYPRMRVLDQVRYFGRLAGMSRTAATRSARRWLDQLGLSDRLGDEVRSLSHGNQQRVQLAIALVHDPSLLVLDEPFSGLDPIAAETMRLLLSECARDGASVLFSSHQLDMVEQLCRDAVIVHRGRVVIAGPVEALRSAQPTRLLAVDFAHAGGAPEGLSGGAEGAPLDDRIGAPGSLPEWAAGIVGARRVDSGSNEQRIEVPKGIDVTAALARASEHGEVLGFSFEPPSLSAVFRRAVAEDAVSAGTAVDQSGTVGGPAEASAQSSERAGPLG